MLVEAYFLSQLKADQVLELLPDDFIGQRRASCQSLFLGALRHGHRSQAAYRPLLRKSPRPLLEAVLMLAGFELFTEPQDRHPKIVHHAVERSKALVKRHEQGFLNAVLRKLARALSEFDEQQHPAQFYSHPAWLVERWMEEFGEDATRSLLEWNQRIPGQTIRLYSSGLALPEFLRKTQWEDFYHIDRSADWKAEVEPLLSGGDAYIKDPSTRIAPTLLAASPGMDVLDLCAAPGGKSYDLANQMGSSGRIVAVDLPGNRIQRLTENMTRLRESGISTKVIESDLLEMDAQTFKTHKLPVTYDAVMLDAPCSNTGVIQRRTDVKWRLNKDDFKKCARLQLQLLKKASAFVGDEGKLVYSTCSIEEEENLSVVNDFLGSESGGGFVLEKSAVSYPWQSGHDGAGAFLLRKAR